MGLIERGMPAPAPRRVIFLAVNLVILLVARATLAAPAGASARVACEAALALEAGGHGEASSREPCHSAFIVDGGPQDMRNEVASLMSPRAHPSLDDLVLGSLIADAAVRKAPDQPWGYLARCDIARRLGSANVLESCLADLRRLAPAHPATRGALGYAGERAPFWAWILRAILSVGLLGTLAHALLARRRTATAVATPKLGAALLIGIVSLLGPGVGIAQSEPMPRGDQLSKIRIDDANPEAGIPDEETQNKRPLEFGYYLQDLAAKAERSAKGGDHAAEARYYQALTKAVPAAAFGPRKLCVALDAAGDVPGAVVACRTALTRQGSVASDYVRFVDVVLSRRDPVPPLEQKELRAVIDHLAGEAQLGTLPATLRCEVALRFRDTEGLETCTADLAKTEPNNPKTVSFEWALALQHHDRSAALQLVDRARGVGMSNDGVAKMEEATRQMGRRRLVHLAPLGLGGALIAALLAFGFRYLVQRRRLAA